jgi:DNA-binding NarL/FixJ family response regulator
MKKKSGSPGTKRIGVLIADDHMIIREGLGSMIRSQPDMRVVGEAADGRQAVDEFFRLRPAVLLLDLRMPQLNGIEVIRAILGKDPRASIVVLSTYGGDEDIHRALQAGAKAYLLKDTTRDQLRDCIRAVAAGHRWIPPKIGEQLAARLETTSLTGRELEIIRLMVVGRTNKEIGNALGISVNTVKVHIGHILEKLGAGGRAEAVRIALERGIAHLEAFYSS